MSIATRNLILREGSGNRTVQIRLFAPVKSGPDWSCLYEIDWPHGTRTMTAFGFDSMQAVVNALQMIGADLYTSNYHKEGKLTFEKPGGGYGFPVPASLRDLLVGDDRGHV